MSNTVSRAETVGLRDYNDTVAAQSIKREAQLSLALSLVGNQFLGKVWVYIEDRSQAKVGEH